MTFHSHAHSKPVVIQGNFQGRLPAFAAQTATTFPQAVQRQYAPHVQAALGRHAPSGHTAQRQGGPQPHTSQPSRIGNAFRVPAAINLSRTGQGKPLPEAVRQQMESFFDADFSDVRVHVGSRAQSIGTVAFTMDSQIHFAPGQYNPSTSHGLRLLGHELTHVMQQRAGRVRNPFGTGMAVVQDPGMEAEADRMGIQASAHRVPVQLERAAQLETGAIQRRPDPVHGKRALAPHVTHVLQQRVGRVAQMDSKEEKKKDRARLRFLAPYVREAKRIDPTLAPYLKSRNVALPPTGGPWTSSRSGQIHLPDPQIDWYRDVLTKNPGDLSTKAKLIGLLLHEAGHSRKVDPQQKIKNLPNERPTRTRSFSNAPVLEEERNTFERIQQYINKLQDVTKRYASAKSQADKTKLRKQYNLIRQILAHEMDYRLESTFTLRSGELLKQGKSYFRMKGKWDDTIDKFHKFKRTESDPEKLKQKAESLIKAFKRQNLADYWTAVNREEMQWDFVYLPGSQNLVRRPSTRRRFKRRLGPNRTVLEIPQMPKD